ncbi:hypothetical protein RF11_03006 [Thelohanellus kitauei]|uniref:Uncharacterized protein n=1 Tax=Thelohanellus kitauei TaxID=669202 RepID=A0A0C2MVF4_THEKT|nr:hypothetical protein RF11_03006 [Thelohanellus kitauei]
MLNLVFEHIFKPLSLSCSVNGLNSSSQEMIVNICQELSIYAHRSLNLTSEGTVLMKTDDLACPFLTHTKIEFVRSKVVYLNYNLKSEFVSFLHKNLRPENVAFGFYAHII